MHHKATRRTLREVFCLYLHSVMHWFNEAMTRNVGKYSLLSCQEFDEKIDTVSSLYARYEATASRQLCFLENPQHIKTH